MTFHKVLGLSASLKVLIVFFPFWPLLLNWTTFSLPWLWLICALSFTPLINSKHLYDHCSDMHSSYALVCVLLEGTKCFAHSFTHSANTSWVTIISQPQCQTQINSRQRGMPSAPTSLTFWRGAMIPGDSKTCKWRTSGRWEEPRALETLKGLDGSSAKQERVRWRPLEADEPCSLCSITACPKLLNHPPPHGYCLSEWRDWNGSMNSAWQGQVQNHAWRKLRSISWTQLHERQVSSFLEKAFPLCMWGS